MEKPQIVILADQAPLYVTRPCRNDLLYRKTFQHLTVYPKTEREKEIDMLNEFRQMLRSEFCKFLDFFKQKNRCTFFLSQI